jgi:hypothetical protein
MLLEVVAGCDLMVEYVDKFRAPAEEGEIIDVVKSKICMYFHVCCKGKNQNSRTKMNFEKTKISSEPHCVHLNFTHDPQKLTMRYRR